MKKAETVNSDHDSAAIVAGIRPEHLKFCALGEGLFDGQVLLVEQLGGKTFIYFRVDAAEQQVVVKMAGQSCPRVGNSVGLGASRDLVYQFEDLIYQFDKSTDVCMNSIQPEAGWKDLAQFCYDSTRVECR